MFHWEVKTRPGRASKGLKIWRIGDLVIIQPDLIMEDIILDTLAAVACIIGFLNLTERKERENWTDPFSP